VLLYNYVEREDRASQTLYAGGLYESETVSTTAGLVVTKTYYYAFGSQQTAMRQNGVVYWLHGDHLGSASLTTDGAGHKVAELRYYPFGETRYMWGSTLTDHRFTGQIELPDIGLYDCWDRQIP
jgi:hypothetical protein